MQILKSRISYSNAPVNKWSFELKPWWKKSKLKVCEELEFENRDKSKLIRFFWELWTIRNLTHGSKRMIFQKKSISTSVKFSTHGRTEEIEPVAAKKKFEYRDESMIAVSGNFELTGLTQGKKQPIFRNSTPLQLQSFWLTSGWKKWALFSWRKRSCNIQENQN